MLVPFRPFARSIVAVFCTSLAVALMGAATPSLAPPTTLVIFPFRVASGVDPANGTEYITRLGAALTALGGVKVVMGDAATVPADYLRTTKTDGGDYYLIGYIAPPLNGQGTVIQQIVSARSGTVVWSGSAYLGGGADVLDQGPIIKNALVTHATRGFTALLNSEPKSAAPAPAAAAKKASAPSGGAAATAATAAGADQPPLKLPNEAYGFSSKPTAPPKVYASANHPSRFVVLTIAGTSAPPVLRNYAATALIAAFQRHGQTVAQGDPDTTRFPLVRGPEVCTQTGARYLVTGSVSSVATPPTEYNNWIGWSDASFSATVYDCGSHKFVQSAKALAARARTWQKAVDDATDAAVTKYVLKVATVATSS